MTILAGHRPEAAFTVMTKENAERILLSYARACEHLAGADALFVFASAKADTNDLFFRAGCRCAFQARMARVLADRVEDEIWDSIPEIRAAALWLLTAEPFDIWWEGMQAATHSAKSPAAVPVSIKSHGHDPATKAWLPQGPIYIPNFSAWK